jgi:O-methyltransferase domain
VSILDAHPGCRGILFDALPHDRVERRGGDFFQSVPKDADAYILRWIIHDGPEAKALRILRNVRDAMKRGGRLMLVEMLKTTRQTGPRGLTSAC